MFGRYRGKLDVSAVFIVIICGYNFEVLSVGDPRKHNFAFPDYNYELFRIKQPIVFLVNVPHADNAI